MKVYILESIVNYEGAWNRMVFKTKERAEKVMNDIKRYDEIGKYEENSKKPEFYDEMSCDDYQVLEMEVLD